MISLHAATKYAALSKRINLGEPRRAMHQQFAVKQLSVVRLLVVSTWITRVVVRLKRQM